VSRYPDYIKGSDADRTAVSDGSGAGFSGSQGVRRGRLMLCTGMKAGGMLALLAGVAGAQNYHFDSTISREVLDNYLARSLTFTEMLTDDADSDIPGRGSSFAEHLRFIQNTGAKFIGRAVYRWPRADRIFAVLQ